MILPNKDISHALSSEALIEKVRPLPKVALKPFLTHHSGHIRTLVRCADQQAQTLAEQQIRHARTAWQQNLQHEIRRTEHLLRNNAVIHDNELTQLQHRLQQGLEHIDSAHMPLDAIRAIITTHAD